MVPVRNGRRKIGWREGEVDGPVSTGHEGGLIRTRPQVGVYERGETQTGIRMRAHACTCARHRGVTYLLVGCFELLLHLLQLGSLRVGAQWAVVSGGVDDGLRDM